MIRLFKYISVKLCDSWHIRSHQTWIEVQSFRVILYFKELLNGLSVGVTYYQDEYRPSDGQHACLILPECDNGRAFISPR
jgi:hypothetical protein